MIVYLHDNVIIDEWEVIEMIEVEKMMYHGRYTIHLFYISQVYLVSKYQFNMIWMVVGLHDEVIINKREAIWMIEVEKMRYNGWYTIHW